MSLVNFTSQTPLEKSATIIRLIGALIVSAFFVPQLIDVLKDKSKSKCLNDLFLLGKAVGTLLVILGMLLAGGISRDDWKRKDWIVVAMLVWSLICYIIFYAVKMS